MFRTSPTYAPFIRDAVAKKPVRMSRAQIETLAIEDAIKLHGRNDVLLVDIRDPRELSRDGKVPGAFHCTRGMLEFWIDPQSPYYKPQFGEDKKYVFFCAGGMRSALAAQTANRMGLKPVAHMGVIGVVSALLAALHNPAATGRRVYAGLTLLSALAGAGLGFLWFNAPPAMVFMGDTGSLAIGGALGATAVVIKHEFVLAIVGGLFVLETVSVIVQVLSFKWTGKRIFRMAPLHHHFEQKGWAEPTIVFRFWIIAAILSMVGLATLKLR